MIGVESSALRVERVLLVDLLLCIGAASLAGCGGSADGDEPFLLAKARAAVAFAEAEVLSDQPSPQTTCGECDGTGTVPSGDGLARMPCECGSACQCEASPQAKELLAQTPLKSRRKRLLYFTAGWCATCRQNEPTFAALASAGWRIGAGEDGHVQIVDVESRRDLASRYGIDAVPAWVLIDGKREVRRACGVLDPFAVGRIFE